MGNYKCNSSELGTGIGDVLSSWTADVQYGVKYITNEKAEKLKVAIKNNSPVSWKKTKRRGKYKRSWRIKTTKDTFSEYERTVYAGGSEYRLTHLLENGHKIVKKGKAVGTSPPKTHIAPVAEKIKSEYYSEIKSLIKSSQAGGGGLRTRYKK